MGILMKIEATNLNDAWFQVLDRIMTSGRRYLVTKGSYAGIHRAGIPIVVEINFPGVRPLSVQMPEGSNIAPPTTEEDIEGYCLYLMTPVKQPNEHYTYGEDLWWQIEWVIDYYRKNGHGTNHCYMTVGRPETLYHYDLSVNYDDAIRVVNRTSGAEVNKYGRTNQWNKLPEIQPSSQCLRGIDTWIDDGKLCFWVYFRSWDHWGGFPVNLGGIQMMKELMAGEIGVKDGPMIVSSKDLHIYEHTWVVALMRLRKEAGR
jgi:thymidylate synthase